MPTHEPPTSAASPAELPPRPRASTLLGPGLATMLAGVLLLAASLPAAAQSDGAEPADDPAIRPILASSEIARGPNRFLFSLTDRDGALIASPDVEVDLRFYDHDVDPDEVAFESESRFLWAVEDVSGLYAADVTFPHAGRWGTRFEATFPDGRSETVRADYDVAETTSTPAIGGPAPAVDSPTADDVDGDLGAISTDEEPIARLYELSIAEAVEAGDPAVIAFVTPAFCQTATCGPTLEKVKAVAESHPEVDFVHVEPYAMQVQDGRLQPLLSAEGQLQAAPWTTAWGLRAEPFIAVVDAEGIVRAKFEGAITPDELEAAIAAL